MARVYDEIRRGASKNSETLRNPLFRDAVVVSADNVADYLEDTGQYGLEATAALPCVLPPFRGTFVEWKATKNAAFGWLFDYADLHVNDQITIQITDAPDEVRFGVVAWLYSLLLPDEPLFTLELWLDEYGGIVLQHDGYLCKVSTVKDSYSEARLKEMMNQRAVEEITLILNVALWTLAFFHTAKVEIEEITPPEKLNKKHQKRYHVPLCTYKTIKVNAIGTKKQTAEDQGGEHGKHRLHICRGHWRDCRHGAGLFGNPKATGIYWIRGHWRGSDENGAIKHQYEVEAP